MLRRCKPRWLFLGLMGAALALAAPAQATDFARQNYLLHCAGCHLPDGSGSKPNDVPSLHGIPGHFASLPEGRAFLSQVPGIAYTPLTDVEAAEVLNWTLQHFSKDTLPPDFKPFTPQEVAKYRAERPASIFVVRSAVLGKLAAKGVHLDY